MLLKSLHKTLLLAALVGPVWAQKPPVAPGAPVITGVYTCVDAKGRVLTADARLPTALIASKKFSTPAARSKPRLARRSLPRSEPSKSSAKSAKPMSATELPTKSAATARC